MCDRLSLALRAGIASALSSGIGLGMIGQGAVQAIGRQPSRGGVSSRSSSPAWPRRSRSTRS
jgi:F0F1-type ATP synthase membrane subunit c/vacuolar-type H+-ATPase subunit K